MASSGAPSGSETEEGSNAVVFSFPRTDSYLEAVSRDGKGFAAGPSSAAPAEGVSRPAGSAAQPAKCFRKTLWDPRNLLSFISFAWLTPMLKVGFRRTIQSDDFPGLPSRHESERITDRLEMYWQREVAKPSPSILNALHCAFAFNFWGFALLSVVDVTLLTLQPFFLTRLVRNLTNNDPDGETYANAAGLCLVTIFFAILLHTWALESWRTGMEARTGAMGMIYRKVLRMSTQALADTTTGHVITMVSVDVERFIEGVVFAPSLVIGPCQMIVVIYLLWQEIGPAALAATGTYLLLIPVQLSLTKFYQDLRKRTAHATDERVKFVNEVLAGMRAVKMHAWETPVKTLIEQMRQRELALLTKTTVIRGVNLTIFIAGVTVSTFAAVICVELTTGDLTTAKAFSTLSYMASLKLFMGYNFQHGVLIFSECAVVLRRIRSFLLLPEVAARTSPTREVQPSRIAAQDGDQRSSTNMPTGEPPETVVSVDGCSFGWGTAPPILQQVSFKLSRGELIGIAGPVGCGKSTLLQLLLGELAPVSGSVEVDHRQVFFASQIPWIMAASVQDNVTFGSEFVSSLYSAVVQQCQLESDIASFPAGSQTQLGERGITLSGGQKARIGLARAVYACLLCARQENTHPVLLLDDPLSAVDVTVGRAIVEECICGLAKDVTRVLVTHQVQFAEACDHVLVLGKDGSVVTYGTYADLFAGGLPAELQHSVFHDTADAAESNRGGLDSCAHEQGHVGSFDRQLEAKDSSGPETISTAHQQGTADSKPKTGRHSYALSSTPVAERGDEDGTGGGAAAVTEHKVIADEEREEGRVQLSLLLTYVKADGTWFRVVAVGLLVGAAQTTQIVADWYLSQWMALSPVDRQSTRPLAIYSGLIALFIVVAASRVVLFMRAMIDAARVLHTKALSAVLGASLAFFDTQPVGRILNRFSRDIGYLDELLPATLLDAVSGLTMCLGSIVLVSGVNPWLFLAAGPVVILMALVRMFYIRSAREVKRIEGMMRSPVYAHLSTTLEGLVVIRSHDTMVTRFRGDFHAAQDEHTKAFFIFVTVSRWLGARLDAILVTFIVVTTFVTVALRDSINPGEVALGLVYTLQWAIRQSAEVENMMTSCERVLSYCKLPGELSVVRGHAGGLESDKGDTSTSLSGLETAVEGHDSTDMGEWPTSGQLQFRNVNLFYNREDRPILQDLSFEIASGQKVGVVGRTGAGKSSLFAALLNLTITDGTIVLDHVDVSTIPLAKLRKAISVIPQEPILFSTSLRRNLDPFLTACDADIWSALEDVQLAEDVRAMPHGLESLVSERGQNYSIGQRQLICLARAIIRHSRVLMIDEATAHVDNRTDTLIQSTIRSKFKDCTVLTIAHRLNTVMDSDVIFVMDEGRLIERGTPTELAGTEGGHFASLLANMDGASSPDAPQLLSGSGST